jgi:SAM-dependent methyltransferase
MRLSRHCGKIAPMSDGDPWLDRWLPLIATRAVGQPILELGCGGGRDSATLASAGHAVVGIDLSAKAVANAQARVPGATFNRQDLRAPLPVGHGLGVILASLSLHYFEWSETIALVARIRDHLRPGGILICRLNSTTDVHFGATGHPRIADNFYLVDGAPKRFFDRESVDALFADGWTILSRQEQVVGRYEQPKALWEVVAERAILAADGGDE